MRRAMLGLLLLASACASARSAAGPPAPRRLSADSMAVLAEAVRLARPAFGTQEEALLSGVYGPRPTAPALATAEPHLGPTGSPGLIIQIAAFRDLRTARAAAAQAKRQFPEFEVVIESADALHRVGLAGTAVEADALDALRAARRAYPDAWLRSAAVP